MKLGLAIKDAPMKKVKKLGSKMRFALYGVFLNIMSSVKSVFSSLITSRYFVYCLFFYGIFLRLVLYFQNRSFWIDDAALATKIISYNYSQLFL